MHACARDQSELLCGIQIGKTRKRSCKNTRTCALEPDLSLCFCIVQSQPTKSMLCLPHALEGTKYIMEFKEISKSSKTFKTDVSSQVHGVLSKDACNSRRTGLVVERSQLGANPPPRRQYNHVTVASTAAPILYNPLYLIDSMLIHHSSLRNFYPQPGRWNNRR